MIKNPFLALSAVIYVFTTSVVVMMNYLSTQPTTPLGRAIYFFDGLRAGIASDASYGNFFVLSGTVASALWLGTFAVLAVSKYVVPPLSRGLPRKARLILLEVDLVYNAWLVMSFLSLSSCFFITVAISLLLLLPGVSGQAMQDGVLAITVLVLLGRLVASRYISRQIRGLLKSALDTLASFKRSGDLANRWRESKISRGLNIEVLPERRRADQYSDLYVLANRAVRRIDRLQKLLVKTLGANDDIPFSPLGELALSAATLLALAPKASYAGAVVVATLLAGTLLLVDFARKAIIAVPTALTNYEQVGVPQAMSMRW